MSSRRRDSQEAIQRVLSYTTGLSQDDFMHNEMVQDAVLRNLQIIGEATKLLSSGLRTRHPDVPWRDLAGLRDRIVHRYFGVDYGVVWAVIREDLAVLLPLIEAILEQEDPAGRG